MQIEQVGLLEHATLELIYVEIKVFGNIDRRLQSEMSLDVVAGEEE